MPYLESVNVGVSKPYVGKGGRSGIDKVPAAGPVAVTVPGWGASGVAGDTIVDKPNHGGPDQAVYAYAREDLEVWAGRLDRSIRGGFFGENRQDNVLSLPAGTVRQRFGEPERVVLYLRARPGQREECYRQAETILRLLRKLPPGAPNDFSLSTSEQIIATFDAISARIGLAAVGLAAVSLLIGTIGIANVMFISVTERTREIGLRLAVGARRGQVLMQFLVEAAVLSGIGGASGVVVALTIGTLLTLVVSGFSAVAPLWAVIAALASSVGVGIVAGYWPARRAAALDPVESLRHE